MRTPIAFAVDDDRAVLSLVGRFLQGAGFETQLFSSGQQALAAVAEQAPDVALVDLQMPEMGGLDVLRAVRAAHPECQVVLMTGHSSVDTAMEAVKLGALDYLSKPVDFDRLRQLLIGVREEMQRRTALLLVEGETARQLELCGMIGRSGVMQELFNLVRRIAPHARAALVTGETGSGKEGIARAIHQLGPRRNKKLLTINCSAVVETLFESELFGHVRGAFTGATDHKAGLFEVADGGTLFLDEIGELPLAVQAKLLRVIETGEVQRVGSLQPRKVDVRTVAATNRELEREAAGGRFRADLYYRLNVVELRVPSLRERPGDIPYLTAAFVKEFSARFGKPIERVSAAAERVLMAREWLGNVRELRNVLERACMLAEGAVLTERDLSAPVTGHPPKDLTSPAGPPARTLSQNVSDVERAQLVRTLAETAGNKNEAALRLGISRRTLYRRLVEYGLLRSDPPDAG